MKKETIILLWIFGVMALNLTSCKDKGFSETEPTSCCSSSPIMEEAVTDLPDLSVYHLEGSWKNQLGEQVEMIDFAGVPVVLTMFFSHCEYACPLLVHDMKEVENKLENRKDEVIFVLVSFDHKRDTPERLKLYAESQGVGENWMFLHGSASQIKSLSVVLGINYEELENGQFAHSNRKLVLDRDGVVVFKQDGLQTKAEPVVSALTKLLH